jgi:hypothetical protein
MPIEREALSYDARVAPESPLPKAMTEHNHARPVRTVFLGGKGAAENRRNAEERKQTGGDSLALNAFGITASGQAETIASKNGNVRERPVLFAPVNEVGWRYVVTWKP